MNLVHFLLRNFAKEEWVNSLGMVISSILVTILQANGISRIISSLIYALQNYGNLRHIWLYDVVFKLKNNIFKNLFKDRYTTPSRVCRGFLQILEKRLKKCPYT
jgi:hypothetical protein